MHISFATVLFLLLLTAAGALRTFQTAPARVSSSRLNNEPALRIGHGFDIHRLIEGTKLVIGGVTIPHTKGAG